MRRALSLVICWLSPTLGCGADPVFVRSEAPDADTAEAIVDSQVVTEEVDAAVDGVAGEIEVEEEVATCPSDCGPGASCVDFVCACEGDRCTSDVTDISGISPVGTAFQTRDGGAFPVLAYVRGSMPRELVVARWTREHEWAFSTVGEVDSSLQPAVAARGGANGGLVVAVPRESAALPLHWEVEGGWNTDDTGIGCSWAHIEAHPSSEPPLGVGTMILGCLEGPGSLAFYDVAPDQAEYLPYSNEPLFVGKAQTTRLQWTVRPDGRRVVVWTRSVDGKDNVVVARSTADAWDIEVLAIVTAVSGLDVTRDGDGRIHVVFAYEDGVDSVIGQRVENGVVEWEDGEIRRRSGTPGFGTQLAAAPGQGPAIGVLWNEQEVLLWNEANVAPAGEATSLDVAGWESAYAIPAVAPRPVVVLQYFDKLTTWLPRGP